MLVRYALRVGFALEQLEFGPKSDQAGKGLFPPWYQNCRDSTIPPNVQDAV